MIYTDQIGEEIIQKQKPSRIISLVPSQTELLFSLGLQNEIVGITKFCIHPLSLCKNKEKIGGTKNLNTDKIFKLNPDIVFANKEENVKEQITLLKSKGIPIWTSDIKTLQDALSMIHEIGRITDKIKMTNEMIEKIESGFNSLSKRIPTKVAYLIWKDPYMTIGSDTFINEMLSKLGLKNIFDDSIRYPIVTLEEIKIKNPDLILLSSEPFPFKEKHVLEIKKVCINSAIKVVDGTFFSWYGSRLLESINYFQNIFK